VSDGLLAAQNDTGIRYGESRLTQCLDSNAFLPARALYERILTTLGEFGAVDDPHDDRSLFVVGHDLPPTWEKSKSGSDREKLLDESLAYLKKHKLESSDLVAIRYILDEAIRNAHEHGNHQNQKAQIEVKITLATRYIHVRVRDEGGRLNERVSSVPLRAETLLEDKGRGFLLIRHYSDHLWIEDDSGELNAVRLRGER